MGQQICPVPSEQHREKGSNVEQRVHESQSRGVVFFLNRAKKLLGSMKVAQDDDGKEDSYGELSSIKQCKSCIIGNCFLTFSTGAFSSQMSTRMSGFRRSVQ